MSFTLYDVSIPAYIRGINNLSTLLTKAEAYAKENGIPETEFIASKLIDNMLPLSFQVQAVSNTSKFVAVRVAGATAVPMKDDETTFAQLQERLAATIKILEGVDKAIFEGKEDSEVVMQAGSMTWNFTGKTYVFGFATPNFYFHLNMAYAIMRKAGVPIGKMDYLGTIESL